MRRQVRYGSIAVIAAFGLLAAACGDDDSGDSATTAAPAATTAAPATTAAAATTVAVAADPLDANGDGEVLIGVAVAGDANDNAYYQSAVDGAKAFAAENGYPEPIYIDKIEPAASATEITNLAEQGVDIMIISSGEISDPIAELAAQYSDIFWYCRCDDTYPQDPNIALSGDDSSAIEYIAGYATGLLLKERGGDSVYMLGGSGADFEVETELAFRMGLEMVDPAYTITYVPTGAQPFDFENVAGATEAFNGAVANGADAIYPYLGGAHEPIVQLANDAGLIVMSAGRSDVCTANEDLKWDLAIKFDGGDYIAAVGPLIKDGRLKEGEKFSFSVEPGSVAGAEICNPSAEAKAALDAEIEKVAAGTYQAEFDAIRAQAYGG